MDGELLEAEEGLGHVLGLYRLPYP
jgi:hypothetical protein